MDTTCHDGLTVVVEDIPLAAIRRPRRPLGELFVRSVDSRVSATKHSLDRALRNELFTIAVAAIENQLTKAGHVTQGRVEAGTSHTAPQGSAIK